MQNILEPIDFSKASEKIVALAQKQAEAFKAKLWLLHVAAPNPDFVGYEVGSQYIRDDRAKHLKEEHQKLHTLAESLRKEGLDCGPILVQGQLAKPSSVNQKGWTAT